jgi:hypothetical protein
MTAAAAFSNRALGSSRKQKVVDAITGDVSFHVAIEYKYKYKYEYKYKQSTLMVFGNNNNNNSNNKPRRQQRP